MKTFSLMLWVPSTREVVCPIDITYGRNTDMKDVMTDISRAIKTSLDDVTIKCHDKYCYRKWSADTARGKSIRKCRFTRCVHDGHHFDVVCKATKSVQWQLSPLRVPKGFLHMLVNSFGVMWHPCTPNIIGYDDPNQHVVDAPCVIVGQHDQTLRSFIRLQCGVDSKELDFQPSADQSTAGANEVVFHSCVTVSLIGHPAQMRQAASERIKAVEQRMIVAMQPNTDNIVDAIDANTRAMHALVESISDESDLDIAAMQKLAASQRALKVLRRDLDDARHPPNSSFQQMTVRFVVHIPFGLLKMAGNYQSLFIAPKHAASWLVAANDAPDALTHASTSEHIYGAMFCD